MSDSPQLDKIEFALLWNVLSSSYLLPNPWNERWIILSGVRKRKVYVHGDVLKLWDKLGPTSNESVSDDDNISLGPFQPNIDFFFTPAAVIAFLAQKNLLFPTLELVKKINKSVIELESDDEDDDFGVDEDDVVRVVASEIQSDTLKAASNAMPIAVSSSPVCSSPVVAADMSSDESPSSCTSSSSSSSGFSSTSSSSDSSSKPAQSEGNAVPPTSANALDNADKRKLNEDIIEEPLAPIIQRKPPVVVTVAQQNAQRVVDNEVAAARLRRTSTDVDSSRSRRSSSGSNSSSSSSRGAHAVAFSLSSIWDRLRVLGWKLCNVMKKFKTTMFFPYATAYVAPWCPGLEGQEDSHSVDLTVLDRFGNMICIENLDFFWTNSDVVNYLLENGNTPIENSLSPKDYEFAAQKRKPSIADASNKLKRVKSEPAHIDSDEEEGDVAQDEVVWAEDDISSFSEQHLEYFGIFGSDVSDAVNMWKQYGFRFVPIYKTSPSQSSNGISRIASQSGSTVTSGSISNSNSNSGMAFMDLVGLPVRFFRQVQQQVRKRAAYRVTAIDGVVASQCSGLTIQSAGADIDIRFRCGIILENKFALTVSFRTAINAALAHTEQVTPPPMLANSTYNPAAFAQMLSLPACLVLPIRMNGCGAGMRCSVNDNGTNITGEQMETEIGKKKHVATVATSTADLRLECASCTTLHSKLETVRAELSKQSEKSKQLAESVTEKNKLCQSLQSTKRRLEDSLSAERDKLKTKVNVEELTAATNKVKELNKQLQRATEIHMKELVQLRERERKRYLANSVAATVTAPRSVGNGNAVTTTTTSAAMEDDAEEAGTSKLVFPDRSEGSAHRSSSMLWDSLNEQIMHDWAVMREAIIATARVERVEILRQVATPTTSSSSPAVYEPYTADLTLIIEQTEAIFAKRNSFEKCNSLLMVVPTSQVQDSLTRKTSSSLSEVSGSDSPFAAVHSVNGRDSTVSARSPRIRTRVIENKDVTDLGGLLVEWFDDYFEGVKTYSLPVDAIAPVRVPSSEASYRDDGTDATFPLFSTMGNARYLFPSRLCFRDSGEPVLFTINSNCSEAAKQQKRGLMLAYETIGKVLNQMLREGVSLPECFASPLLLRYLLFGLDGLRVPSVATFSASNAANSYYSSVKASIQSELSVEQLHQYISDFDYDSFCGDVNSSSSSNDDGVVDSFSSRANAIIQELRRSNNMTLKALYEKVVYPFVLRPRMEALQTIKKGFDSVPLIPHFLRKVPLDILVKTFTSVSFVSADRLVESLLFRGSSDDVLEAFLVASKLATFPVSSTISLEAATARVARLKDKLLQLSIDRVTEAIKRLSPEECSSLLKFWTGSASFMPTLPMYVTVQSYFSHDTITANFPEFPLAKSLTCTSQLFVPIVFDVDELLQHAIEVDADEERGLALMFSLTSVEDIRTNLLNSCLNISVDYSDKAVIYSRR